MEPKSMSILNYNLSAGSTATAGTRSRGCCRVHVDEEFRNHVTKAGIFSEDKTGSVFTFLVIFALLLCR
jgi:hypothetical protein